MAEHTHIEWTDSTWNVVNGCSVVSPGCTNCYAMRLAGTRLQHHPSRSGLTQISKAGPVWTGEVRFNDKVLLDPLRWRRPRKIFVCAHGDLFHENVPDEWIDKVFAVMALCPQHVFQVLTKRPERMRGYMTPRPDECDRPAVGKRLGTAGKVWNAAFRLVNDKPGIFSRALDAQGITTEAMPWPLPNVWLGVSVEDQKRADERIPILLDTPAAIRWLSCEPLLGPVDLTAKENLAERIVRSRIEASTGVRQPYRSYLSKIDWVIAGGESGPGARPMDEAWARSLRDQCADAGVPFLFKQWGAWLPAGQIAAETGLWNPSCGSPLLTTKKNAGRLLDGVQLDGYPQCLS